ncbi:MAG: hypothetical protein INH41_02935 [Myxococcaceae bacterium]|nr:hypothetical protein [Myxococcaceae bacterium]
MRALALVIAGVALGCPSPEEAFRLSGRLVDDDGRPRRGHEVRVFRDASPDGERCTPMEPFATLTTDDDGRYQATVFRQQQTLGGPVPRFFRVETSPVGDETVRLSATFRFPPVDVQAPELTVSSNPSVVPQLLSESLLEAWADGAVAWRGGVNEPVVAEERPLTTRLVFRATGDIFFDANLLGLDSQWVSPELRLERPYAPSGVRLPSRLRGRPCRAGRTFDPCPWTDGRMTPVRLPPGVTALTVELPEVGAFEAVTLRALQLEGEVNVVHVDVGSASEDGGMAWAPWVALPNARDLVAKGGRHCPEAGVFLTRATAPTLGQAIRVRAEDAAGAPVVLRSLAEVSIR